MEHESSDSLVAAINGLTGEVAMLREVIEEFRVCFERAVHNDRLRGAEPAEESDLRPVVLDLREKLALLESVVEGMRRMPGREAPKEQRRLFESQERPSPRS